MALNIPMPDLPGTSFLKGVDTGSSMFSRMIQPVIDREKMKQQNDQFMQNLALQKQAQGRAQTLLPYMIQQYQDVHNTAANEAAVKEIYRNLLQNALGGGTSGTSPVSVTSPSAVPSSMASSSVPVPMPSQGGVSLPNPAMAANPPPMTASSDMGQTSSPSMAPPPVNTVPVSPTAVGPPITQPGQIGQLGQAGQGEHELRPGNPRLAQLDMVAGLVPGIPKPVQHITNGMIFTTYPSGRMTVQQVQGALTPGEKTVSAKEASKIRDQATALVNSANLVNQGYGLLSANPDLTGPGNIMSAIPIPFSGGTKVNLSNNPALGQFNTVTGKLQAELGKYAASRGGIQAVRWASSVKPSAFNPENYNYGMFEGVQQNLQDDYNALNQQYKAATGEDLPISLPQMVSPRIKKTGSSGGGTGKVTKWKLTGGQLVKE